MISNLIKSIFGTRNNITNYKVKLIGESYFELQKYKDAIKYFNKSYKINYNIKPLFKIGKCYEKSNDTKNAIKYFKNVIKKEPRSC